ncbi:DUF559 domain-containing protein [uncultured Senegalimassilia sp.]|uniref:DUF559 domain-containing protein n=1 Tax=uncultured Senegalimassilia sp. TaxID=1714350 RepID=UPI0025EAA1F9|nr:DUF559 domain-containing protein [uncultured Senegalimassilia sp.]
MAMLGCMGILLTDISALETLRASSAAGAVPREAPFAFGSVRSLQELQPHAVEIRDLAGRGLGCCSTPLHVLVPRAAMRRNHAGVRWHVHEGRLAGSSFSMLASGVFAVRPEFALLHVGQRNKLEALAWAFELAGSYRVCRDDERGFVKADPLIARASLSRFARAHSDLFGSAALRRVGRYVLEGAASPMESALAMLLCLPASLGGFGLPAAELNARVDISVRSELSFMKRYYVADMCWRKQRVIVEYDSDAFHAGPGRIAEDAARRNALLHMGYDVVTVSRAQIMNRARCAETASVISRAIGHRLRIRASDWPKKHLELRSLVLPKSGSRL